MEAAGFVNIEISSEKVHISLLATRLCMTMRIS